MFSAQWKPTDDIELEANYFRSDMEADNYNRNYMLWGSRIINGTDGTNGQVPLPGYVVRNNTLVLADFAPTPGADPSNAFGIYDQISRPGAKSSTEFFSLEGKWDVSDKLQLQRHRPALRKATARRRRQDVAEWDVGLNTGAGWQLNGVGAADWHLGNTNTGVPGTPNVDYRLDWIFGSQDIDVEDKEDWGQLDGTYFTDGGVLQLAGLRRARAKHERNLRRSPRRARTSRRGDLAVRSGRVAAGLPELSGRLRRRPRRQLPAQHLVLQPRTSWPQFNDLYANRDPVSRFYYLGAYGLEERSEAAYGQLNFGGERWSAQHRHALRAHRGRGHQLRERHRPDRSGRDHHVGLRPVPDRSSPRTPTRTGCRAPTSSAT